MKGNPFWHSSQHIYPTKDILQGKHDLTELILSDLL